MKSDSDEPPSRHSAGVDISEFFFPGAVATGAGVSALLIHGLTGTPYEMRYLGERLAIRGVRVRGVKLAGHAGLPEELGAVGYDNWYESVVNGLEELRQYGEPIVVVGLSMGAVLSARLRGGLGGGGGGAWACGGGCGGRRRGGRGGGGGGRPRGGAPFFFFPPIKRSIALRGL